MFGVVHVYEYALLGKDLIDLKSLSDNQIMMLFMIGNHDVLF